MENRTGFYHAKMIRKVLSTASSVFYIALVIWMVAAVLMPKGPPLDQIQQQIRAERMIQ